MPKVREVIQRLEQDGWRLSVIRGDHRQYVHPSKPGKMTVAGQPSKELPTGTWISIQKQAGWRK